MLINFSKVKPAVSDRRQFFYVDVPFLFKKRKRWTGLSSSVQTTEER